MPQIPLASIKLDQRAQPRVALNTELTAEYAAAMAAGDVFPPLTVFQEPGKSIYWLADGFHRHYAATNAGLRDFSCVVKPGGVRDAILFSCKANSTHGSRRTDEDKRRAVLTLLDDGEWSKWSDREIARQCQVSADLANRVRREREPLTVRKDSEQRSYTTKHGTPSTMNTARIGKPAETPVEAQPPEEELRRRALQETIRDAEEACRTLITIAEVPAEDLIGALQEHNRTEFLQACAGAERFLSELITASEHPPV